MDGVFNNNDSFNLKENILLNNDILFDEIYIGSAFFSEDKLLLDWLEKGIRIKLIILLQFPTNYYSLNNIFSKGNIEIKYFIKGFHSKIIIMLKNNIPVRGIIGSSNFTENGLSNNIETNYITDNPHKVKNISNCFNAIWNNKKCYLLEPRDLITYKEEYDEKNVNYNKYSDKLESLVKDRNINRPVLILDEAKKYFTFCKYIDIIKNMVSDISEKEYPNIPVYLTIDHFWHWVKTEWVNKHVKLSNPSKDVICRMFSEYCVWDKNGLNYTSEIYNNSVNIFQKYLSRENIKKLNANELKLIYSKLHSGGERAKRFGADEKFITENKIENIVNSLEYLLYSNDDIDIKISNLCTDGTKYKLRQMKFSAIQELLGWVEPERYPIRNKKSDDALELIGFKIE